MKKIQKILLSVPAIISLLYIVTYMFPTDFVWLIPNMDIYYLQVFIIQGLTIVQLVILLRRLWHYKTLDRSKKNEWTWLLILFPSITSLIYIWKKDQEFYQINTEQKSGE
jgi:hypothetical protein